MASKITLDLIRETLDRHFPGHILQRGYQYYLQGHILEIEYDEREFTARVAGSGRRTYLVGGIIQADVLVTHCNCPYDGHCKHEAAVLYEIRDTLYEAAPQTVAAGKKQVAVPTKIKLEGNWSAEYRKLPLGEADLATILQQVGMPMRLEAWNSPSFQGKLTADGQLTLRSIPPPFSYQRHPKQEIVLKKEGRDVLVKCNSCKEKTPKLCSHQTLLLKLTAQSLQTSGFLQPDFTVEKLTNLAAQKTGVEPSACFKYYELAFNPNGFALQPKKGNIFLPGWINTAKEQLQTAQALKTEKQEKLEQQLAESRPEKSAFLWLEAAHDSDPPAKLQFMQGNKLKTKEGIHSLNRKVTNLPHGFPAAQMKLARQLYFHFQAPNLMQEFYPVKELIEQHIETLNEVYQYVSTSDRLRAADLHLVKFQPVTLEAKFSFTKVDGLLCIRRQVLLDGQPFAFRKVLFSNGIFCATADKAYLYPHPEFEPFMDLFGPDDSIFISPPDTPALTELIQDFKKYFETKVEEGLALPEKTLSNPDFQILLRELGDFILFEPRLSYGAYSVNAFNEDAYFIDDQLHRVDESDRRFLVDFIKNAHPDFDSAVQVQDFVYLPIRKMLDNYWFLHFNETCEAAGIELLGQKDLSKFKYSKHKAATFSHVKSGIDWFDVEMGVSFGGENVKMADWIRALRNNESFVTLKDGSLGILPAEWLEQAKKVLAVAEVEKGELKISKYRFNIIEDLFADLDDQEIMQELAQKKKRLAEIEVDKSYALPKAIIAELRPYQKHGFAWLKFLEESGFGGILADDMGLGKTLQVLALLADQPRQPPSLIVVPRSLLFNWGAEIDKFCPSLSYNIHHGTGRAKTTGAFPEYHLIITTYGTATADIEFLKNFDFNYIVLDESQAIKNPASKRYKAMRLLRSRNKLTMTGTPIENNTFDLYAQMSFCSPGLLGTPNHFKKNFAVPIDNEGDQEKVRLLRKMIHPFILRRTKEQVAKELPEKTETVIYCEMGNSQRRLYENLKQKIKADIESELEDKGFERSKFKMLDGLLRLRQMCNSPLLLNQSFQGQNAQSVKIDVLIQNLTEELDKHNALVFSQFVGFLTLIRRELDKRGIRYAYLDGSTRQRQAEVEKFMQKEEVRIFLISLKAGNTGLNLTKADYVYLLDPWWNPAVESQAIDRTHRIGQDKNVFAYKLICKDSIEEKILKLQARKKERSADLIRTDENAFKALSKEELLDLFN